MSVRMPTSFQEKKAKILAELNIPEAEYQDLSPKGSVDAGIKTLISEVNESPDYVTTSSCSGRVAIYLEGAKGAKGGGKWLFTSHNPLDLSELCDIGSIYERFGLTQSDERAISVGDTTKVRFVHFKFEPLILHIFTSSLPAAQKALSAALQAGLRESGINGVLDSGSHRATPMVAVRSSGLAFDCIIGHASLCEEGKAVPMVSENYLRTLVAVANQRFEVNKERTKRFREALLKQ